MNLRYQHIQVKKNDGKSQFLGFCSYTACKRTHSGGKIMPPTLKCTRKPSEDSEDHRILSDRIFTCAYKCFLVPAVTR